MSDPARRSKYDSTGQIDDVELKIDQEARDFVISIMQRVINTTVNSRQDLERVNIVKLMGEVIKTETHNHETSMKDLKQAIDKLTRVAKRFKSKTTHNLLQMVINQQISELKQRQATGTKLKKIHEKASIILSDFSYDVDTAFTCTATSFVFTVS